MSDDETTTSDDAGARDVDDDRLSARIADGVQRGVARVLETLGGNPAAGPDDDEPDDGDDGDADVSDDATTATQGRSARAVEDSTEAQVRAALAKIHKEEATDARLEELEKKTAEKPPVKERRVSKAIWG
jgi:hypothetical protein